MLAGLGPALRLGTLGYRVGLIARRRDRIEDAASEVVRAGGTAAYARIHWQRDPEIEAIVAGWPQALAAARATALGFAADAAIDEAVQAFIKDDLDAQKTFA